MGGNVCATVMCISLSSMCVNVCACVCGSVNMCVYEVGVVGYSVSACVRVCVCVCVCTVYAYCVPW